MTLLSPASVDLDATIDALISRSPDVTKREPRPLMTFCSGSASLAGERVYRF